MVHYILRFSQVSRSEGTRKTLQIIVTSNAIRFDLPFFELLFFPLTKFFTQASLFFDLGIEYVSEAVNKKQNLSAIKETFQMVSSKFIFER